MRRFFRATDRATASRFTPLSLSPTRLSPLRARARFFLDTRRLPTGAKNGFLGHAAWLGSSRILTTRFHFSLFLRFARAKQKKKGISRGRQFAGKHGDKGGGKSAYISYLHLLWAFNYLADMRSKLATVVFLFLFLFGVGFRSVCGWRGSDKLEVMIRFGCRFHSLNQTAKGCVVTDFLSVGNAINTRLVQVAISARRVIDLD